MKARDRRIKGFIIDNDLLKDCLIGNCHIEIGNEALTDFEITHCEYSYSRDGMIVYIYSPEFDIVPSSQVINILFGVNLVFDKK